MRLLYLAVFLIAQILFASELVILRNGVRIDAESRTVEGSSVFLLQKNGMTVIVDQSELYVPPAAPVAAVLAVQPQGQYDDPSLSTVQSMINQAAERHGLPASLVHAVASAESGYQQKARSGMGAIGVMQLMPATARYMGADPSDPAQNIDAGTRLLRELLLKYEGRPNQLALALAAYNAGPGAVDRFGQSVPPFAETRNYVKRIKGLAGTDTSAPLVSAPTQQIFRQVEVIDGHEVVRYTDQAPAAP